MSGKLRLLAALAFLPAAAFGAATIVIEVADPAGVGFNDPTPVAPVGGNAGTTLGQQRLNAFQFAASKWGATVASVPVITIRSSWAALSCTSTGAVLGSAGPVSAWREVPGTVPNRWYGAALANKIFGSDLNPNAAEINAQFNVNLGRPGCLDGIFFYLGLDNQHGANIDLVTVLEHEFAHGLGFLTFTNGSTGALLGGFPSIYDDFLLDTTLGKTWSAMTNAERQFSAINPRKVVWTGANVTSAVPAVLAPGTPELAVSTPANVANTYPVGTASFGPPLGSPGITGEVMPVVDTIPDLGLACTPLSPLNAAAVTGKIAMVDRGTCTFTAKVKNAQDAGAIGVILVNNAPGSPPPNIGGTDATITIPTVVLSLEDGGILKTVLRTRSRIHSGLFVTMRANFAILQGADVLNRALLFTPTIFSGGSSVSHWDQSASPNQLMEPTISTDLTHEVTPPQDLTFPLLRDLGWN